MGQVKGRRIVAAAAPAAATAAARLPWADNLKVAVIIAVIVIHAATAYVLDIDWYYQERTTSELWEAPLGLPALLGAVFGLGPLFLLGGVFAAASLARRGSGGFVHGRLLRLGVPLVLFVAVITPLTNYLGDLAQGMGPDPATSHAQMSRVPCAARVRPIHRFARWRLLAWSAGPKP
jgi:uncharacterized protein (DUF697 family)